MEHRCGERLSARVPALLRSSNGGWVFANISNISVGGIYVETKHTVPKNAYVLVRVDVESDRNRWIQEFPCLVVHTDHGGMGLMISAVDNSTITSVEKLSEVKQAPTAPSEADAFRACGNALHQ